MQELLLLIQKDLTLRKTVIVAVCRLAKPISRYIIRGYGDWDVGYKPTSPGISIAAGNGSVPRRNNATVRPLMCVRYGGPLI